MVVLAALSAAAAIFGTVLVGAGIHGTDAPAREPLLARVRRLRLSTIQLLAAIAGGALVYVLTGWIVAGAGAFALGVAVPRLVRATRQQRLSLAKTEAAAAWAEMLRDTLAGGQGLAGSIDATAKAAPKAIRPAVVELAARIRFDHDRALRHFAAEVRDPTIDLIVGGLLLHRGRRLSEMLAAVALSAREMAQMRLRIEAGRGRIRWTARFICVVTLGMALVLAVTDRAYLSPYDGAAGQLMLVLVIACFGAGLWWLGRIAEQGGIPRVLAPSEGEESAPRREARR